MTVFHTPSAATPYVTGTNVPYLPTTLTTSSPSGLFAPCYASYVALTCCIHTKSISVTQLHYTTSTRQSVLLPCIQIGTILDTEEYQIVCGLSRTTYRHFTTAIKFETILFVKSRLYHPGGLLLSSCSRSSSLLRCSSQAYR